MEFSSSPVALGKKIYTSMDKIFSKKEASNYHIREKIRRIRRTIFQFDESHDYYSSIIILSSNIFLKQHPPLSSLSLILPGSSSPLKTPREERFAMKEAGKSLERGLRKDNVCGYGTTRFSFAALRVGQIF